MRYTVFLIIAAVFLFMTYVGFSEGSEEANEDERNFCEQIAVLKAEIDVRDNEAM